MENEFDILNRRMEKNLEMRHTYLMFAFTTAIAALAASIVVGFKVDYADPKIASWICVIPYCVIIPFQARVSYSRLTHAKMEAYMIVFYRGKFKFIETKLNELSGAMGRFIAIIANYELTLLSIGISFLFILIKYYMINLKTFGMDDIIIIGATLIVFALATYTYPYMKFLNKYISRYDVLKNSEINDKK